MSRRKYVKTPLTKAQLARRALVEAPFPVVRVVPESKKSHGGCLISDPDEHLNDHISGQRHYATSAFHTPTDWDLLEDLL